MRSSRRTAIPLKLRIVAATVRLDAKPRKPTKVRRIAQQRQATAWRNASKHGTASDEPRERA